MLRLKNLVVSIVILALVALPSTTSSHNQENLPAFPFQRTLRPEAQQRSQRPRTKFVKRQNALTNRYIVVLNDDVADDDSPREARLERIKEIANSHALAHLGRADYIYETALKGYAIELPNEAAAVAISRRPEVQWVEEDHGYQTGQTPVSPQATPPWGLDAIDGISMPLPAAPNFPSGRTNGTYIFNGTGAGVNAYVIDTGINTAHADFGTPPFVSRATQAADCIRNVDCRQGPPSAFSDQFCQPGGPNTINNDCIGHGTHVAGTLGGNTYGVAKAVNIRSIKVCVATFAFPGNFCPASAIIAGINWVTSEHQASSAVPKVVNISLWFPNNVVALPDIDPAGITNAVHNSSINGVTYVVIAGNAGQDARFYSPAVANQALTVGAVDWNGNRPAFSNWGPQVDLFAPGVEIVSAQTGVGGSPAGDCAIWNGTNTDECRLSGTSQAAPHVAGAVAIYLQGRTGLSNCAPFPINGPAPPSNANLSTCPDRIHRYIKANANRDRLTNTIHGTDANGLPVFSPNLFLWNISVPTLPNPLENHRFFVWTQYEDFLNREPDSGGFQNWVTVINACAGSDWPCINAARIHTVRGFIESAEFKAGIPNLANPPSLAAYNEEYVRQLYIRLLRRPPDAGGFANWLSFLNSTNDYSHVVHGFINAVEYRVRFGPQ